MIFQRGAGSRVQVAKQTHLERNPAIENILRKFSEAQIAIGQNLDRYQNHNAQ
jgi:hypothetical protein